MKFILFILTFFFTVKSFGQKTEMSIRLNSGFADFSGKSAKGSTYMIYSLTGENGHTNIPFGSRYALSYGSSLSLSRILKNHLKFGVDLGYEVLRSKIEIHSVFQHGTRENATLDAEGKAFMNSGFINLFPYIGYRFSYGKVRLDVDGGLDIAYCTGITERGFAETENREYETTMERKTIDWDVRPRIQTALSVRNIGGYIGYSKGIVNYSAGPFGGAKEAYRNVIRFGMFYTWRLRGPDHLIFRRR